MLRSLVTNDVTLDRIAYVGRGEPTLNRNLPEMIKFARAMMPNIVMSMDSNSNQPFKTEYLLMNWINCSVDGSDQESYGTYRRGGQFSKALEFMRAGAEQKRRYDSTCQIRWKYILFDCNDSDEHLNRAQRAALDLGIDELDFIITHCGAHDGTVKPSPRFQTVEQLNQYINGNKIFPMTIGSRAT
jgi:wyosine [tRNA(Phe)-imidazoG37] synthetase (radical SAM superfamily)